MWAEGHTRMDGTSLTVGANCLRMQTAMEKRMTERIVGSVAGDPLAYEVESNLMSCRRSHCDVEVASLTSAAPHLMAIKKGSVPPEMV